MFENIVDTIQMNGDCFLVLYKCMNNIMLICNWLLSQEDRPKSVYESGWSFDILMQSTESITLDTWPLPNFSCLSDTARTLEHRTINTDLSVIFVKIVDLKNIMYK